MLGSAFAETLAENYPSAIVRACKRTDMDITDWKIVSTQASFDPDWIIHCAADVNADRCEKQPAECEKIQVGGTLNIVRLAEKTNARVFYPQSFLIYGGSLSLVDETTPPKPSSVYARCKHKAEEILLATSDDALVVRMAGFFGGNARDKNFVGKFTRHISTLLRENIHEYSVGARVWQPTYTMDLARNSLKLMEQNISGVWCMSSEGHASFFDLAVECVNFLNLQNQMRILPADDQTISNVDLAKRPERLVMSNRKLIDNGLYIQRKWQDALKEYLDNEWFAGLFPRNNSH